MQRRTERVHLLVRPQTKDTLQRAARRKGISLSELLRRGAKLVAFEALTEPEDEETDDANT